MVMGFGFAGKMISRKAFSRIFFVAEQDFSL